MRGGVVDADYELADLEGGEGLLDGFWDANREGGDSVVCVLGGVSLVLAREEGGVRREGLGERTINAWTPELKKQNIQMAGVMKRIPAHMQSIAPA